MSKGREVSSLVKAVSKQVPSQDPAFEGVKVEAIKSKYPSTLGERSRES